MYQVSARWDTAPFASVEHTSEVRFDPLPGAALGFPGGTEEKPGHRGLAQLAPWVCLLILMLAKPNRARGAAVGVAVFAVPALLCRLGMILSPGESFDIAERLRLLICPGLYGVSAWWLAAFLFTRAGSGAATAAQFVLAGSAAALYAGSTFSLRHGSVGAFVAWGVLSALSVSLALSSAASGWRRRPAMLSAWLNLVPGLIAAWLVQFAGLVAICLSEGAFRPGAGPAEAGEVLGGIAVGVSVSLVAVWGVATAWLVILLRLDPYRERFIGVFCLPGHRAPAP